MRLLNKMKYIIHGVRLDHFLRYKFLLLIFVDFSGGYSLFRLFISRSSKEKLVLFLETNHKAFLWSLLILLFKVSLRKIHTSGQFENWDFIKAFIRTRLLFESM